MKGERQRAQIKIEILGKSPHHDGRVYARLKGKGEKRGYIHDELAWISARDITLKKQELGPKLTGTLSVNVIEKLDKADLVEVEVDTGRFSLFLVKRNTHELIPFPSSPDYRKNAPNHLPKIRRKA